MPVDISTAATAPSQRITSIEAPTHQVVTQSQTSADVFVYAPQSNTITRVSNMAEEQRFRELAEQWYVDTMPLSSYIEKILHPAYQKILVLGKRVVPYIIDEIRDMPNDWFWALRMLTDSDPVRTEDAGNMQAMADAWIQWWEVNGAAWRRQNGF